MMQCTKCLNHMTYHLNAFSSIGDLNKRKRELQKPVAILEDGRVDHHLDVAHSGCSDEWSFNVILILGSASVQCTYIISMTRLG